MLAVLAAAIGVPYFVLRLDEQLRRHVEARIAEHYPHLNVSLRSARLVEGEGIEVRGLSIVQPALRGQQAELLYIDELFLRCSTDWQDLVLGQPDATNVVVRNPTLRATLLPDGSWSSAALLPLPRLGEEPPSGVISHATVEIHDPVNQPDRPLVLRNAEARLTSAPGANIADPDTAPLMLEGQFNSDSVRDVQFALATNHAASTWRLAGKFDGLDLSPELLRTLPAVPAERFSELAGLRGRVDGMFNVVHQQGGQPTYDFEVSGQLTRGRIDDARLPYPVTDLVGAFRCDEERMVFENVSARHGHALLQLQLERAGYADDSPLVMTIAAQRLALDRKLLELLPASLHEYWADFQPSGEVDLRLVLSRRDGEYRPELDITCNNVAFTYHKFPYRLENARGRLALHENRLTVDMLAQVDRENVQLLGELTFDGGEPHGWFQARGQNLRIDDKLIAALPESPRTAVESLQPLGSFDIVARWWRDAGPDEPLRDYYWLAFHDCAIRCDRFAYPLTAVQGVVECVDNVWSFRDLVGVNDTGRVTCQGHLVQTPEGPELVLRMQAHKVPLEAELRDALSPGAQRLWDDMKPRGVVNLEIEVRQWLATGKQQLWVRAEPLEDTVSVEPVYLPYRIEKIRGSFIYADDQVHVEQLFAQHGRTRLTARGHCKLLPGGGWNLHLERIAIDRLEADRELLAALPGRLKKSISDLRPTGPVNLRGTVDVASSGAPGHNPTAGWDLNFDFQQNSFYCGVDLQNVNGGLNLVGRFDGEHYYSFGQLQLDSLTYRNLQFTELMGPLLIEEDRILLGYWADRTRGAHPERNITARFSDGTVVAEGWLALEPRPHYQFRVNLVQADLARLAREAMPGTQQIRGKVVSQIDLRGAGPSINDLSGRGVVHVRDADIYELPVMVSLLKLLSVRPPDATAFTAADINFRIQGQHVYMDNINFEGDAVSLQGQGELGFDKQLKLVFRANVGRQESAIPMVRDLLGGASQQILLIHVDGTLDDPQMRREAFPGVNQALQTLQAELQGPPLAPGGASPMAAPASRPLAPPRR